MLVLSCWLAVECCVGRSWCWRVLMMHESSTLTPMMISCLIVMGAQRTSALRSLLQLIAHIPAVLQTSGVLGLFSTRCWLVDIHFTTVTPSLFSVWSAMVGMLFRSVPCPSRRSVWSNGYCAVIQPSDHRPVRSCIILGLTSAEGHRHVLIATILTNLITAVAVAKTSVLNTVSDVT